MPVLLSGSYVGAAGRAGLVVQRPTPPRRPQPVLELQVLPGGIPNSLCLNMAWGCDFS